MCLVVIWLHIRYEHGVWQMFCSIKRNISPIYISDSSGCISAVSLLSSSLNSPTLRTITQCSPTDNQETKNTRCLALIQCDTMASLLLALIPASCRMTRLRRPNSSLFKSPVAFISCCPVQQFLLLTSQHCFFLLSLITWRTRSQLHP